MKCFSEEQIQQYHDNECSEDERKELKQHLGQCRSCSGKLAEQREKAEKVKLAIDLLITHQPEIPEFQVLVRTPKNRIISLKYILPLIAAASLLLLFLIRPLIKSGDVSPNGFYIQSLSAGEFDANRPVTDYPLIITVVAPDGSVTETFIN